MNGNRATNTYLPVRFAAYFIATQRDRKLSLTHPGQRKSGALADLP
jgi:hypothetical protein